jgi:GH15 family glucan-1,4-alpha-glucosidase
MDEVIEYLNMIISGLDENKKEALDRGYYALARKWVNKKNKIKKAIEILENHNMPKGK